MAALASCVDGGSKETLYVTVTTVDARSSEYSSRRARICSATLRRRSQAVPHFGISASSAAVQAALDDRRVLCRPCSSLREGESAGSGGGRRRIGAGAGRLGGPHHCPARSCPVQDAKPGPFQK